MEDDEAEKPSPTTTQSTAPSANTIRDAAQTLLAHLLKFVHDFPTTLGNFLFFSSLYHVCLLLLIKPQTGPEVVFSQIEEADDRDPIANGTAVFTTFGENMLLTICEVPNIDKSKPNMARLFARDPMGRFAWNFDITKISMFSQLYFDVLIKIVYNNDKLPHKQITSLSIKHPDLTVDNETFKYTPGKPADNSNTSEKVIPQPDKLKELLLK